MFQTAFAMAQQQQHWKSFPSGNKLLDRIIGGGFEPGMSHLLYGSPHCSKLLQQAIANALRLVVPDGCVVVIDGNNSISLDMICNYLKRSATQQSTGVYLNKLHVARAFTTDQLLSLLIEAPDIVQRLQAPVLFVTGLLHLLREEEDAGTSFPIRPGDTPNPLVFRRVQYAAQLKQLAFAHKIAVIVSADSPKRSKKPPLRLGHTIHHLFHVLILHTRQDHLDTFFLLKHPNRPCQQLSSFLQRFRTLQEDERKGLPSRQAVLFD